MNRWDRRRMGRSFSLDEVLSEARLTLAGIGRKRQRRPGGDADALFSVLDLGTTHVKALVCRAEGGFVQVLGRGVEPYQSLSSGRSADAAASPLAHACEDALCHAEDMTQASAGQTIVPDYVVVGVPGQAVSIGCYTARYRRRVTREPITQAELRRALASTQRAGIHDLVNRGGIEASDLRLLADATEIIVEIDGHSTDDPIGLRGSMMNVTTANAVVSSHVLDAIERLSDVLKFDPPGLALPSQAILHAWKGTLGAEGIGVDVGGRGTTVSLWRSDMLRGLATIPIGGRDFTVALARACGLDEDRAEKLKLAYARREFDGDQGEWLGGVMRQTLERWSAGMGRALRTLSNGRPLPADLWLWGGGAGLGDVYDALRTVTYNGDISFTGYPSVHPLGDTPAPLLVDRSGFPLGDMGINAEALAVAHAGRADRVVAFGDLIRLTTGSASRSEGLSVWSALGR